MTLADKIWAAIQRVSPPVTKEEIAVLLSEESLSTTLSWPFGSVITREDLDDNIVKFIPEGWALDRYAGCYRPAIRLAKLKR